MIYNLERRLEREIVSLAKKFGVKKLILFGSRARGTNRERSDIDLAVSGGDVFEFAEALEELDTLLLFDVVNLDDKLADDFKAEINRDGIILYEEVPSVLRKYDYFSKSLKNLTDSIHATEPPYSVLQLTGIMGLFEICFEQSWKMMRQLLESHSLYPEPATPRMIIKFAYQYGMINDEETWLEIQTTRNLLAHTYSEEDALDTVEKIKSSYLAIFLKLKEDVEKNWLNNLSLDNRGHDDSKQN